MNLNLQNSIKMASVRYSLNTKYNSTGNRNKNIKILRAVLVNNVLGNIEFNTGKMWSKGGINYMVKLSSTEHNYSINFTCCRLLVNLELYNNVLSVGPKKSTTIKDNFENYSFELKDCIIRLYLTKKGVKCIKKFDLNYIQFLKKG